MQLVKSIIAVIVGLTAGIVLSLLADMLLMASGLIQNLNLAPFPLLSFIIGYRFVFNVISCWLAARLAPDKPMRHAIALGCLGFLISLAGAIFMWDQAPAYYNIGLIVLAFPAAWLGGRLYDRKK